MSQTTQNSSAFIDAEIYSDFILTNLEDGLLGESFYRNVADFGSGTTLNIKTVGKATIQEAAEDTPLTYNPIETGLVTLTIDNYVGDAWYVTDDLREDGAQIPSLMAARAQESTRAIQEVFETRFLQVANDSQVQGDPNLINGFPHRLVSTETNNVFSTDALVDMRLAFNKANVPAEGRVFIVDSVAEATINKSVTISNEVTPFAAELIKNGMASGQAFVMQLFGWSIMTSNRLPTGSYGDGTTTVTDGVVNIAMCILDDQTKPLMGAWRRMPKVEGDRNKDYARDEFITRARWGMGPQRVDTLGTYITSASNY